MQRCTLPRRGYAMRQWQAIRLFRRQGPRRVLASRRAVVFGFHMPELSPFQSRSLAQELRQLPEEGATNRAFRNRIACPRCRVLQQNRKHTCRYHEHAKASCLNQIFRPMISQATPHTANVSGKRKLFSSTPVRQFIREEASRLLVGSFSGRIVT